MAAVSAPADDPKAEQCQCGQINAPSVYAERGQCVVMCGVTIERKHVMCRPCALGNHTGLPCQRYVREGIFHFTSTRTCASCGIDSSLHREGHDGRPLGGDA